MCKETDMAGDASLVPAITAVLNQITQRNKEATVCAEGLQIFTAARVPPVGIGEYVQRIAKYAYCSPECFVFALVYLDRLIAQNANCTLTPYNVHRLLITSVLLAAKARDDTYYSNAYYSAIGGISNAEMNRLEISFLTMIGFNLFVAPELYAQYRSQLMAHVQPQMPAAAPETVLCSEKKAVQCY
eukprot:TRINITY_DN35210_c0_g1_i1.p1 TRINITY_DN35210_c0_g1~~TRINITY_DN35210_c0_g1_i1.p1  ORF type:complete len:186 (-),score=29.57 TRINITY_DN35210_c0_g1_i1:83-640(-)